MHFVCFCSMKKITLFSACGMFLFLLSCYACGKGEVSLTPEQLRLQKIARIDTTLQDFVQLEAVEGFDRLTELSAEAWMLVDDSTGFVISQKNADKKLFIASITKMMTCLLALENGNMDDTLFITKDVYLTRGGLLRIPAIAVHQFR